MYTCNDKVKTISKQVGRLFNNLEIRTNHYINNLLDTNKEVITLQTFNEKVLSFSEVKQLKNIYNDYTDIINCQVDETIKAFGFNKLDNYNDRVNEFIKLTNNKLNEFINSKYAQYLDLKSYRDFNISKAQKKELEQLAEKYNTYDIDKLKKKIEKDKDNDLSELIISVGAMNFLNNLNKKNEYLNNKSKTAVSLSGKRKYNIGNYMSFAFQDMIAQDLANNRQAIYKANGVEKVVWKNNYNPCAKCDPFCNIIYDLDFMEKKPQLHFGCRCYLIPVGDDGQPWQISYNE